MAPKYHPTPLSGGDRKALNKELTKARGVTLMLARQSEELRAKGDRRQLDGQRRGEFRLLPLIVRVCPPLIDSALHI